MDKPINVTKTLYRVDDFLSWQRADQLDLRPEFQRGSVWNKKAKSFLIDSILRGFPVPILFLQSQTDAKTLKSRRRVVDGQQRLRTVLAFVDPNCLADYNDEDDFTVSRIHNKEIAGRRFHQLSEDHRKRLLHSEFPVHVLPEGTPNSTLLEIFARLNSSGVKVNRQELRNAQYQGEFKQTCYSLAFAFTDEWTKWRIFNKQGLARMKEVELVSDLVSYMLEGVQRKSQDHLDKLYEEMDDDFHYAEASIKQFERVMTSLGELYSGSWNVDPFRTQGWFYPMFATIHGAMFPKGIHSKSAKRMPMKPFCRKVENLATKLDSIRDEKLLKALRGAATDKASREVRLRYLTPAL